MDLDIAQMMLSLFSPYFKKSGEVISQEIGKDLYQKIKKIFRKELGENGENAISDIERNPELVNQLFHKIESNYKSIILDIIKTNNDLIYQITQEQHLNPNEQSRDSIISKYKSYLISYFPFKENFQDCLSTSSSIPIHQIPGESPVDFTKNGFKFGESYVMGYISDLPSKQESRTFFFWFRSTSECKIDKKTVFLFSYGHSKLNKSFGLFVGKPEISEAHCKELEHGIRVFTFCPNSEDEKILSKCDSDIFMKADEITDNRWYYVALSFDKRMKQLELHFGDNHHSKLYSNHKIIENIDTHLSDYLYVGSIVPELTEFVHRLPDNSVILPTKKWIFKGHIREFMAFDTALNKEEIIDIASSTHNLL